MFSETSCGFENTFYLMSKNEHGPRSICPSHNKHAKEM